MDLTPLVRDVSIDPAAYVQGLIDRFAAEVRDRIGSVSPVSDDVRRRPSGRGRASPRGGRSAPSRPRLRGRGDDRDLRRGAARPEPTVRRLHDRPVQLSLHPAGEPHGPPGASGVANPDPGERVPTGHRAARPGRPAVAVHRQGQRCGRCSTRTRPSSSRTSPIAGPGRPSGSSSTFRSRTTGSPPHPSTLRPQPMRTAAPPSWWGTSTSSTACSGGWSCRLRPGRAALEQTTTLYNRTDLRHRFYWWTNAAVEAGDDSKLIYPMELTASHGFTEVNTWPVAMDGVDLSRPGNHREGTGLALQP